MLTCAKGASFVTVTSDLGRSEGGQSLGDSPIPIGGRVLVSDGGRGAGMTCPVHELGRRRPRRRRPGQARVAQVVSSLRSDRPIPPPGGLFRLLATDAKTAELTGIRRFADRGKPTPPAG